jgi:two-component sensor histidine kinase
MSLAHEVFERHAAVPARPFLESAATAAGAEHATIACDAALKLATWQLGPLAAIIDEAIDNALTHAYPDRPDGPIWLSLASERGRMKLAIRDDGVGFPVLDDEPSHGRDLVRGAADQLHGYCRFDNRNYGGAEVTVVFPA